MSLRTSSVVIGPGQVPHVVWLSEAEAGHIYVCHRDGDTWSIPRRLTAWTGHSTWHGATADRQGRIHLVWQTPSAHQIFYARYQDTTWSGPELIASDTARYIGTPSVAADRQGHAHVAFAPPYSSQGAGYLRQTDSGWTMPVYLPSYLNDDGGRPRIALDTLDRPHIVWEEWSRYIVFCSWTGDSWTRPERLDSIEGNLPSLCMDPWNQMHVFFCEDRRAVKERTWHAGQ